MVDVTTATVSNGALRSWATVPRPEVSSVPRGEVLFEGSQAIPVQQAVDESLWTLQCNFPRNFIYRIAECRIWATANGEQPFINFQPGIACLVSTDDPAEVDWFFMLSNRVWEATSGDQRSFDFTFLSGAVDNMTFFLPEGAIDAPISAAQDAARLFFRWADVTTTTTGAVTASFRVRCLMYDIDQASAWPMHTPLPTIGP